MSELVLCEPIEPGLTALTLNRADRRNALSIALLEALCAAIDRLQADPSQRVAILKGAGPVFSAGLDLKEAAGRFETEWFDVNHDRAIPGTPVTGGAVRTFTTPFPGPAALYLKRAE